MKPNRPVQLDIFENSRLSCASKKPFLYSFDSFKRAIGVGPWLILIGIFCLAGMNAGCAGTQLRLVRLSGVGYKGLIDIEPADSAFRMRIGQKRRFRIPAASQEVMNIVNQYGLANSYLANSLQATRELQTLVENSPRLEGIYATAQLAGLHAQWAEQIGEIEIAFEMNKIALEFSSLYIFDSSQVNQMGESEQDFNIRKTYNQSLEGFISVLVARHELPGTASGKLANSSAGYEIDLEISGRWRDTDFSELVLSRDFEVGRFQNQYRTDGLSWGVPLIAVRKKQSNSNPEEMYYPAELPMPMTAVFQIAPTVRGTQDSSNQHTRSADSKILRGKLILFDPLEQTTVAVGRHRLELEVDTTTPLAYGLKDPFLNKELNATASLVNPEYSPESYGLFMLEPFDPNKIPVIFVHGFWSSATTWVHMLNELRGDSDLQKNYQFWFYSYPTGQPFWESARELRSDIEQMVNTLDPHHESIYRNQTVMVGHSMGGLLSLMQTFDSGHEFWKLNSDYALSDFQGDPETLSLLEDTFYFRKNPSIDRVITIATPFGGSRYSNKATQWFGEKIISASKSKPGDLNQLIDPNRGKWKAGSLIEFTTSIESLNPENSVIDVFNARLETSNVNLHNIAGRVEEKSIFPKAEPTFANDDGVVDVDDAISPIAISKKFVPSDHNHVHQHPETIEEVCRLLRGHLALQRMNPASPAVIPSSGPASSAKTNNGTGVQFRFQDGVNTLR